MNMVDLELQNGTDSKLIPSSETFQRWVELVLKQTGYSVSETAITIRVVSEQESQQLNNEFRQKDKPTNVLSFPFEAPEMIPKDELDDCLGDYLGDLIICESIVLTEAKSQNKAAGNHWAHLTIHGVLHLLGFDHIDDTEAKEMEDLEIKLLESLNISNPYLINN